MGEISSSRISEEKEINHLLRCGSLVEVLLLDLFHNMTAHSSQITQM